MTSQRRARALAAGAEARAEARSPDESGALAGDEEHDCGAARQLRDVTQQRSAPHAARHLGLAITEEQRSRWAALPEPTREAIAARVKAEHPHLRGLRRGKALLEPLCLAEYARILDAGEPLPTPPPTLFPEP